MQVHSQPLCGPPADIPLLEGDPVEGLPQHQDVLQERSAAQSYKNHNSTAPPRLSPKGSLSPSENASTQRSITTGAYYTGNVHAQHIGLAGFGVERSEKQIRCELGRLYKLLQRSEKYQTYREKQPALTPAEVVARDAAERKEQEKRKAQGLQQEKDKTVWPDFLEHAFWIALVRWPPMGRKKYMLEGTQRGRNELIQDSIYRDTGIRRDRKQVSSHLQVLKDKLRGVPAVLLYMTTPEDVTKRRCTNIPVLASHSSHVHGRQHAQRTDLATKYEYSTSSPHVWPQHGGPQPDLTLSFGPDSDPMSSPFTVTRFEMVVESDHQPVHCLTQMHSNGRLDSFEVLDLASWRRQYCDLDFLLSETESWMRSGRKVLVCTASIGSMAGVPSDADLITTFDLDSHVDLSTYDHLECMTRFYDDQDDAVDAQFDSTKQYREEERTSCEYQSGFQGSKGVLRVDFGAQTWIRQMREYQYMRHRDDEDVREPLQYLTATQDIYGIVSQAGKAQCLLTVLWRFNQTENSAEVGSMEWRSVNFASYRSAAEEKWCHETEHKTEDVEDMEVGHEQTANNPMFTPPDVTSYHQASQLPPDFAQTHVTRHPYETEPHHHHQPPSLSIDVLGSMQPDSDNLDSSAATTTTEFSQQSFALSHTQGMGPSNTHSNDFDFNCRHIPISGAFESTMNMPVYGSFPNQSAGLGGLHTLAGLEHDDFSTMGLAMGENGQLVPVDTSNDLHDSTILSCYSTKPHWQHACLISHLENAAEQYNSYPIHDDRARGVYNQEVIPGHNVYEHFGQREESAATNLHDFNHSLWGLQELQSPFQDDTGSGAARGVDYRKEQTYGSDYGVPDLVERHQKGCGY